MAGESLKSKIGNFIESGKNRIETTKKDIGSIAEKAAESGKNFIEDTKNRIETTKKDIGSIAEKAAESGKKHFETTKDAIGNAFENTKDAIGNAAEKVKPFIKENAVKVIPIVGLTKGLEDLLKTKELKSLEGNTSKNKDVNNDGNNDGNTSKNKDVNNDGNKKEENRGSGILGILTRIAGKAYDNANAAVGNNTDLYGLAKDLTGYTNAEIRNKEIDSSIAVKQAIDSALGVQSGIANLYKNDENFKNYMDRTMGIFQRLFNKVADGSMFPDELEKIIMDIYEKYKNKKEGNK